jgi:two-component system NtrC family sensor kinase
LINESLDICTITDSEGVVVVRALNFNNYGDKQADEVIKWVIKNKEPIVSTTVVSEVELMRESRELAERAKIELIPTPKARYRKEVVETSGMMIKAAAPVFDNGSFIGVLYGGKLLNRNYKIVDKVKDIVYRGEVYKGIEIGTTTIFLDDLRISTNVVGKDGKRAIGTRVSKEVYDYVFGKGKTWIGRAFVVSAWYLTAYEPIKNLDNRTIGMLYVGMLEKPYIDLRNKVILTFLSIAILAVILLLVIANKATKSIVEPIKELVYGAKCVAEGDLSYKVKLKSEDEIGELAKTFNKMTDELKKITESYLVLNKTLEDKIKEKAEELRAAQEKLIQSEKLTALGKLSAAIAHEVNNPLTSILLNGYLLSESIGSDQKNKDRLNLIIEETTRCSNIIKGLLEFARQSIPEKKPTDVNG